MPNLELVQGNKDQGVDGLPEPKEVRGFPYPANQELPVGYVIARRPEPGSRVVFIDLDAPRFGVDGGEDLPVW